MQKKEKTGEVLHPFTSKVPLRPNDNLGVVSIPIEMEFPSRGMWKLMIYFDDVLWGTVDVKVRGFKKGATRYSTPSIKP